MFFSTFTRINRLYLSLQSQWSIRSKCNGNQAILRKVFKNFVRTKVEVYLQLCGSVIELAPQLPSWGTPVIQLAP